MRRLVVCCDGTWNRPDQLRNGVPAPTNVSKLALGVARTDAAGVDQLVFYQQGVGTRPFERMRGGALGFGLSRNVRDCFRFIVENYEPGDELYLLGFSRGAFTARSTAGLVRNAGILRREHAGRVREAYRLYRDRGDESHPNGLEARLFRRMYSHPDAPIHLVGVWDTVGSLGIPIDGIRSPVITRLWRFHDTRLSSHVLHAYHALAIDEARKPFAPTLWERQEDAAGQTLEQLWFSGDHCDIGGGHAEPELAEIALLWMADRVAHAGLAFEPGHFTRAIPPLDPARRALGELTAADALGPIHDSRRGIYRLQRRLERPLAADGGAAASSAVRRRDRRPEDYAPANLAAHLAAGGAVSEIDDGDP